MKFFTPKDFEDDLGSCASALWATQAAKCANAKLEREGKHLYSQHKKGADWFSFLPVEQKNYRATLINVEPYGDIKCSHPKDKITKETSYSLGESSKLIGVVYVCDCGAKLRPATYEEIK